VKAIILCGGRGTRLSEETKVTPKPLVKVGTKPIVSHIISHYQKFGISEFVLAVGYLGEQFTSYFSSENAQSLLNDFNGNVPAIQIVDTGSETLTGGRLLRLRNIIGDQTFLLTYGDGVSNADISQLIEFHKTHGKSATITAVRPPARFGVIHISESNKVEYFQEKNQTDAGWINGGFFVFEPEIFSLLDGDSTVLEEWPLQQLTARSELMAHKHHGFWQCMDTMRDKEFLEELWNEGKAPWL
jgi:glucose-1-phosphate cytidylyltransferase